MMIPEIDTIYGKEIFTIWNIGHLHHEISIKGMIGVEIQSLILQLNIGTGKISIDIF